jgi:hypothetical protein
VNVTRYYEIRPDSKGIVPVLYDTPRTTTDINPDPWKYTSSRQLELEDLWVPIDHPGARLDVHMTPYGIWLVRPVVVKLIASYVPPSEIQWIPCTEENGDVLEILNTLVLIDCLDEENCEGIQRFTTRDGRDREGKIKWIKRWEIDSSKVDGHHLFRVKGYSLSLVASETLKKALESSKTTGISFHEVSAQP